MLTGDDRAGISAALFETLSPFAISIVDVEQIVISDRLILTVLIALNPSHQKAIEADLEQCASVNDVDIATLFSSTQLTTVKNALVDITITSPKMHPTTIATISKLLTAANVNIESVKRTSSDPLSLSFVVSNSTVDALSKALKVSEYEDGSTVAVKAHA